VHHWAVTFNGTTRERVIHRDGVAVVSDTAAGVFSGGGTFWIGRGIGGGFFNGQLDDVRVWNQFRTGFTVAKDRAKRLLGSEEGLLRYFRFDEQAVSALDSSDSAVPATIAGATRVTSTAPAGIPPRYVTVAENSDAELQLPVNLHVIRIDDGPFTGQLNDIAPPNVFSEKISVRHSSDFGAEPERLVFEWWYKPDDGTVDPTELPTVDLVSGGVIDPRGWLFFTAYTPADGRGVNYVTLGDGGQSSLLTLGDNWFVMRYRGFNVNGAVPWSDWAGDPAGGATARAKLVEGWIKRVIRGLPCLGDVPYGTSPRQAMPVATLTTRECDSLRCPGRVPYGTCLGHGGWDGTGVNGEGHSLDELHGHGEPCLAHVPYGTCPRRVALGDTLANASYRMGEAPAYGDLYSLRVPIEAFLPLTDTNALRIGGLIYLSVRDDRGAAATRSSPRCRPPTTARSLSPSRCWSRPPTGFSSTPSKTPCPPAGPC
jgi:hypothetical protein